jgi:hypothetical protein
MAGNTGFDCDTITRLEICYGRMDGDDLSRRFMTKDVLALNDHGPYASCMPEMHV